MKRLALKTITILACLSIVSIVQAETFLNDRSGFNNALGTVNCIDFEGIATVGGQAGSVNLAPSYTFSGGVTLTPGVGSEGLYVGIPDTSLGTNNAVNFYANDFFPTSGVACLSPDFTNAPAPIGTVHVEFDQPVDGVGGYFLDAETNAPFGSYIEAFDEYGVSLGKLYLGNQGDNSQAFAGIVASGIASADLALGYGQEGVGLDDLCYGLQTIVVGIDIKPGSFPNAFNINGKGVIPVAILGSAEFDVTQIDISTLRFNGSEVQVRGKADKTMCHYEDVNGDYSGGPEGMPDGYDDLVCQFVDDPTFWELGDTEAMLTGNLLDGTPIEGTDSVKITQVVE